MALVLSFGRDDPARIRFVTSPLWETMAALRVLSEPHRHAYHLPWLDAVRPELDRLELEPLLALSPHRGWTPDFLSPARPGPGADITEQLAQVRATPPARVAYEVRRSLTERYGQPVPAAAWRLLDDPAATRARLAGLLEDCWRLLIAPHWPRLRDLLEADVRYRTQLLADYGLERVLADLHPRARWTGRALIIEPSGPQPAPAGRYRLGGAGLQLMPSVFAWPDVLAVIEAPGQPGASAQPALSYPARGIAELWQPTPTRHSAALADLLGRTCAALLESLAEPASTHTLARRHQVAASTVSEHLAVLHRAGLVTRRRHRHTVIYQQAPLGAGLARGQLTQPRST